MIERLYLFLQHEGHLILKTFKLFSKLNLQSRIIMNMNENQSDQSSIRTEHIVIPEMCFQE